jgi:hypothetical protein
MVQRSILALVLLLSFSFLIAQSMDAEADSLSLSNNIPELTDEIILSDSLKVEEYIVPRSEVEDWIAKDREARSLNSLMLHAPNPTLNSLDIYRAAYHAVGLNNRHLELSRQGFGQWPSLWSDALLVQYYNTFYAQSSRSRTLQFSENRYPYKVMVSDIQAGLGDYEYNFARAGFKKDELLGFPGLYYSLDLLVQTGVWTGLDHDQSSLRNYLSWDYKKLKLELELADWAQDNSSQDLLPAYWQDNNVSIDHRLRQFYAAIHSPILEFSIIKVSEKAKAGSLDQSNDILQWRLFKDHHNGPHTISLYHERYDMDLDFTPQVNTGEVDYEYKTGINYSYEGRRFEGYGRFDTYFSGNPQMEGRLAWKNDWLKLGAYGFMCTQNTSLSLLRDIFNPGLWLDSGHQVIKSNYAANLILEPSARLKLQVLGGMKSIQKGGSYNGGVYRKTQSFPYVDTSLDWTHDLGFADLTLRQNFSWQNCPEATLAYQQITEVPDLRYQTHLELKRELPKNNAILGGLAVYGHSDYYLSIMPPVKILGSAILDLWAGVQISKLFDFTVSFKNALDTDIYGTYPIPQSIHANLHWYYLN